MLAPLKLSAVQKAFIILLALGLFATPVRALAQMKASEPDLKAAIIINMAMFIDWPTEGKQPADELNICFLENSPVAVALANAQGRSMRNRTIKVSKIRLNGLTGCHVVYLSSDNREQLPEILTVLKNAPVLIAGDSPDFFKRGAMLNLELTSGHVVFDIDLRSAQKAGLQISSKALRLARQVIE